MRYLTLIAALLFTSQIFAKNTVLILTKPNDDFKKLSASIKKEAGKNYEFQELEVDDNSYVEFKKLVLSIKPKAILLMDNASVKFAQKFYAETKSTIQSVAVMGLNYKSILENEKNICGIAYEVPAYTLITQAKFLFKNKPIKNVLTFYRGSIFKKMYEVERSRLEGENIKLIGYDVESESKSEDYSEYFESKALPLIKDEKKFDSVFIFLDSGLLKPKYFSSFWLKAATESKLPFFVGTEKMVSPEFNFSVFGMSPDLEDLATQAFQMVESVVNGEPCSSLKVQDLLGVSKFLNKKKAESIGIKFNTESINDLKVLE